jgi:hypothetical protein
MFVEITVPAAVLFDLKTDRKPTDRLTAEMGDYGRWGKENRAAGVPNATAQVHFLKVIEKLFVKSAHALKQISAKHNATAGLPVN